LGRNEPSKDSWFATNQLLERPKILHWLGRFEVIAKGNAKHTDLFALGDNLGFGLRSRLLVLAVIWLAHVQANR
jgi:hypothetical protein